jgi:predicted TIM-barrel fold metal-dependent hydrolase
MEPADAIAMARDTNDYLASAVKKHPTRFAGFAAIPTGSPKQAVEELERRIPARLQRRGHQRPQSRALSR